MSRVPTKNTTKPAKKLITIRLPKALVVDLKLLAKLEGIRYQTLVNRVLAKWVDEGDRK